MDFHSFVLKPLCWSSVSVIWVIVMLQGEPSARLQLSSRWLQVVLRNPGTSDSIYSPSQPAGSLL